MNPLQTRPDAWVDIDSAEAEARYARAYRLLQKADDAIAAQLRIIEHDGDRPAYTLALASLESARAEHEHELAELRRHRSREDLYFALDGERYGPHGTSIAALGHACVDLQRLFSRISQNRLTGKTSSHFSHDIQRQTRLIAEASFPSSFGLHLTIPTQSQTDGYSLILDALEETFELLNRADPAEIAARHGWPTFSAFKVMIANVTKHEVQPKAAWRGLDGGDRQWQPSRQRLTDLHYQCQRLEPKPPQNKEEEGVLAGASTLSNKFEFVGDSGIVRGQVPRKLIEQVATCFNRRCRIWYEETQILDPNTERVKRHIQLLGAEPLAKT